MDSIKLADIKCGDIVWECERGWDIKLEAMADAHTNGDTVTCQMRIAATGEPLALMMRKSAPAYAPRLYSVPQYGREKAE